MSDIETREVGFDEIDALAELEAMADQAAGAVQEEEQKEDAEFYRVDFDKEYDFDGKKYSSVDMSGLVNLTTLDGEFFDRVLTALHHVPANKFTDTVYTKHVAMRVTKLPVEFFNMLNIRDMQKVTATVYYYFLKG